MTETRIDEVPGGFEQLPSGLGYTDTLQPVYRRLDGDTVSFGLVVGEQHSNSMGLCHGGVLMTLADIAAASGVNLARGVRAGSPTINLSMDFVSAARMGQWIQTDVDRASVKRRFGFSNGTICNATGVVARFNGTFYFPDHEGMWKGDKASGDALQGMDE